LFFNYYGNEPFVRLVNESPELKNVRGTNYCDIMVNFDERTNKIFILSVIDNLVKGASGQAIQNMNIMFGLDEKEGLPKVALCP
jgi:N-acetyl-gamma-glutamyl-phosphate reductase